MKLRNDSASLFIPDGLAVEDALPRTAHLGIGAHQDDLEFMALHGILAGFQKPDRWFGGVTCANGGGSARTGDYQDFSDDQMMAVRRHEQNTAASIGQYSFMAQLDYPSSAIKDPANQTVVGDLRALLDAARPDVVYTHNPADKHDTHIGVLVATLQAIKALPADARPKQVFGCEVWRDLDWMPDEAKIALDVSGHENLAASLNGIFDSQIAGGKRYDLAVMGRRRANATFYASHATDDAEQLWFAMDLTPVTRDGGPDLVDYVTGFIDAFAADVRGNFPSDWGAEPAMNDLERNLGDQPIAALLAAHDLKPHDLVSASTELITHKMVSRACKGRRLTPNVQGKIRRALNAATGKTYTNSDLFTY